MNAIQRTVVCTAVLTIFGLGSAVAQVASPWRPTVSDASMVIASDATCLSVSESVGQQLPQPAGAPPTPRHTGFAAMFKALGSDFKNLPSLPNLYLAAGGGAVSIGMHQLDAKVQQQVVGNDTADNFLKPGQIIGNSLTLLAASATTYTYGRLRDQPKVSHVGMDMLRSLAVSVAITQSLKYATHRERPDHSDNKSFPSGHASDTFAVATVLERHVGWRYSIPGYLFASYVAVSRLPSNRHWLSDVTFGATVGIIAGRTVTRRQRLPVTPVSVPGGMALMYHRAW
jgi:hypothetical protein